MSLIGRVDVLIASGDFVPSRLEQTRERTHACPGNTDEVNAVNRSRLYLAEYVAVVVCRHRSI
jgi:hypothetical protein